MKIFFTTLMIVAPLGAFAGNAEREYVKSDVAPIFAEAAAAVQKSCGCAWKFSIDEKTLKTESELRQAKYTAEAVRDAVEKYCSDAESKKAVCKVKTLEITKGKQANFAFSGGKGSAVTDGQSYCNFEMMIKELVR